MTRALLVIALAAALGAGCPDPTVSETAGAPEAQPPAPEADSLSDGGAVALPAATVRRLVAEDPLWEDALRIHYDAIVLDGHVDTPSRMLLDGHRLGERSRRHHVDLPRMREGGLDGAFFAAYVPRSFGETPAGTDHALAQIAEVDRQLNALDGAAVARTAADVRRLAREGTAAVLLGLEGGHALQADPDVLRLLWANGVRYVTLTHTNTNAWADASTDAPRWGGLNDTGRALVREMNRLGVMVDLSHTSDATVADALEVSAAPPILSHSSCRALHDHARNVSDDVLRAVAEADGLVMINFYDAFLGRGRVTLETVLDHLDHALAVAGPDHVGLGSDFDGVPSLPDGLGDVTRLPWITYGLLKRGHTEADVRKVLGGNLLRVMEAAEHVAADLQAAEPS